MKLLPGQKVEYQQVDPDHFTGEATVGRVLQPEGEADVRIFRVCFQPGARTDWHIHTGVQLLYVEEGRGRVQKKGEANQEIGPGDTVSIDPNERHWHGASAEESMIHLAINIGGHTEWMEKVSDEEYSSRAPDLE